MGVWPLGIFFGTPYWGAISDGAGRKKMLAICLMGTAITYVLGGIAISYGSVSLFIFSRLLSGFFGGSFSLAQAAIADVSLPHEKARNISWVTLALSIGLIIGPFITSITSLPEMAKWFSAASPFWFAAVLACLNVGSILALLPETFDRSNGQKISFITAIMSFTFIFTDKRLKLLAWISLAVQMGWGFYILNIALFLQQRFNMATHDIGIFFSIMGVCIMVMQLFIQPKLFARYSLKTLFIAGAALGGCAFTMSFLYPSLLVHCLVMIVGCMTDLLVYSSLMAICSNAVSESEQGKVMGGAGALFGLAWVINSGIIILTVNDSILIPFLLAGLSFLFGAFIMMRYQYVQLHSNLKAE
jgi:MFS family permease